MDTLLTIAKEGKDSLLINGVHGIGKSEQVKAWAKENGYFLKILFTSLIEETDLSGIPVPSKDNKSTVWLEPDWCKEMKEAADQGLETVLFLDELNRSTPQVQAAALELVLNKEINGHILHSAGEDRAFVCAAINPPDADYNVQEFDPALLDRFLSYTLSVDAEAWLLWAAKNNVHSIVRRFIAKKPEYIHTTSETENITPTPRSWTKLSDLLYVIEKNKAEDYLYNTIKGKVGSAIGAEFLNFYNEYNNMLDIQDIKDAAENGYKDDMDTAISSVKELLKDQEPAIINDFMIELYKDSAYNESTLEKDNVPYIAFVHAAPLELVASILTTKRSEDFDAYRNIAKIDRTIFERILTIKDK